MTKDLLEGVGSDEIKGLGPTKIVVQLTTGEIVEAKQISLKRMPDGEFVIVVEVTGILLGVSQD